MSPVSGVVGRCCCWSLLLAVVLIVSEERKCLSCGAECSAVFSRESVPGQAGYDTSAPSPSLIQNTRPALSTEH